MEIVVLALELSKGQQVNIYIDSKYAYLTLHAQAAIWKERQFKMATGEPIKHFRETERFLTAFNCYILCERSSCYALQRAQQGQE